MLYYLYNHVEELLSVDYIVYSSYWEAYTACRRHHSYPDDYYTDLETDLDELPDDDREEDLEVEPGLEDEGPLADFEAYARRRPDDQG
jgi:hypothetical protein